MAECKPRGPCSGCACESEEAVVKKREEFEDEALAVKKREGEEEEEEEEQEEDVSAAAVDGVVDVERLLQELVDLTRSLLAEEVLDQQFTQLQQLQDESNPEFVSEVVTLFFEDSERLLEELTESLAQDPIDYVAVDSHVHQFKGSSSSIGAQKVKTVCIKFRKCCEEEDREGCQKCLEQVKQEFSLVKSKLEHMFEVTLFSRKLFCCTCICIGSC
jgi:histidine-containing phosphotransfer protein